MEIEGYREHIRRIIKSGKNEPIFNGSLDHARILMEEMFQVAESSLKILTNSLDIGVYGNNAAEQARYFLA